MINQTPQLRNSLTLETYLAVGELAQAAAHYYGLTGPVQFTVCRPRSEDAPVLNAAPRRDLCPAIEQPPAIERTDDFFYAQHSF